MRESHFGGGLRGFGGLGGLSGLGGFAGLMGRGMWLKNKKICIYKIKKMNEFNYNLFQNQYNIW